MKYMAIERTYIDTSVIGGCYDEGFSKWSNLLFNEFEQGLRTAVVSDLTRGELEGAPENVKQKLSTLPQENVENVFLGEVAEKLADNYLNEKVIQNRFRPKRSQEIHGPDMGLEHRETSCIRDSRMPSDRFSLIWEPWAVQAPRPARSTITVRSSANRTPGQTRWRRMPSCTITE